LRHWLFQYCCDIDALATTQRPQAAAKPNFYYPNRKAAYFIDLAAKPL